MVKDNRRIAAPENCSSPNVFRKVEKFESIVNEKGIRKDGRYPEDLKSMSLKVGLVPTVTGSAYLECNNTKIICSVIGPRDVLNKSDSATKGQLNCEFKFAMFSCKERQPYIPSDAEFEISKSIQDSLEPVILLHKFPKSRLDITIFVLENDGAVISAAITCAGAALSNAGVEMYDLPVGCSLIHCESRFLIDPTAHEESYTNSENFTKICMAMMVEYKSQVIFMESGRINPTLFTQGLTLLQSSCQRIVTDIRLCLKNHVEEMNEELLNEPTEGSLSKKHITQVKLLQPLKYMRTFLENDIRTDARTLTEFRPVLIDVGAIGTANGSALVKLGNTSVLCGIKAELTNTIAAEPENGFFIPNVTLNSICSNRFLPGPPPEQAQVYSQMIMELWNNSSFLNPNKLCIVPNSLCWCLFAEIICLSHDGNIFDACILALMAALKNTKLPEVLVNAETNKIEVTDKIIGLELDHFVMSTSYSILNDSAVADPSLEEESLADCSITVILNEKHEVSIHSAGPIKETLLSHVVKHSEERFFEMKELIENLN